jgi:hypothetical protein
MWDASDTVLGENSYSFRRHSAVKKENMVFQNVRPCSLVDMSQRVSLKMHHRPLGEEGPGGREAVGLGEERTEYQHLL